MLPEKYRRQMEQMLLGDSSEAEHAKRELIAAHARAKLSGDHPEAAALRRMFGRVRI